MGCPEASELQHLSLPSLLSNNNTSDDNEEHVSIVISIEKTRVREGGCPHFLALEGHDQACEAIHTKFISNDIKVENKSREAPNDARFKHLMETRVAFL